MLYFLAEDAKKLEDLMAKIREDLAKALKSIGASCQDDPNVWHDNAAYDEAQRLSSMWAQRLNDLQRMALEVLVVDLPRNNSSVEVGHIVVFKDLDTNDVRTIRMGSHMCFRTGDDDITISYAAPLGQLLMGARVGEIRKGKTAKGLKRFQIIEIKQKTG